MVRRFRDYIIESNRIPSSYKYIDYIQAIIDEFGDDDLVNIDRSLIGDNIIFEFKNPRNIELASKVIELYSKILIEISNIKDTILSDGLKYDLQAICDANFGESISKGTRIVIYFRIFE